MNDKAFVLMDIVIGILILGLIISIFINTISNNIIYRKRDRIIDRQIYLGEYIFNRLDSLDKYSKKLINSQNKEYIFTDIDKSFSKDFICKIIKKWEDKYIIKVIIKIKSLKYNTQDVIFYGTIKK